MSLSSFINAFDELYDIPFDNPRAKLNALYKYCSGRAKKVISGCLHQSAEAGYGAARDLFYSKFGTGYQISQVWWRKLLSFPALRNAEDLEAYAMDLVICRDGLGSLGYLYEMELSHSVMVIMIERVMLESGDRVRIDQIIKMVSAAAAEAGDPTFSDGNLARIRAMYSGQPVAKPQRAAYTENNRKGMVHAIEGNPAFIHTFAEQDHDDEWRDIFHATNSRQLCAKCQGQHYTSKCKGYKELSPVDRLQLIREKRICVLCLAAGHFSNDCQSNSRCQEKGCSMKHHTSLHAAFQLWVVARVDKSADDPVYHIK